jgi:quercetin dioxygenase-like cupin family protein
MKLLKTTLLTALAFVLSTNFAIAQDPTVVDATHYTVEFENDDVRVIRIKYGPGEKSVMHFHPAAVAVFLVDQKVKFTLPDGKTEEVSTTAGQTIWTPAGDHLPENIGEGTLELVLVEMKKKE